MKHEVVFTGSIPGDGNFPRIDTFEVVPAGTNEREILMNGARGVFTCECGHLMFVAYIDCNTEVTCTDCARKWSVSGMLYTARQVA